MTFSTMVALNPVIHVQCFELQAKSAEQKVLCDLLVERLMPKTL